MGAIEPMCDIPKSTEKIINPQLKDLLEPLDIFALLMASIGHDVGHPGVNNNFMVTMIFFLGSYGILTYVIDYHFNTFSNPIQ